MSNKKILIADDDIGLVQALTVRLEAEGFEVISSHDAYQALALAQSERPDVMLLDVNMPAGSGFSVQQRIANFEALADTPVIYITGEEPEKVDQTARELGAFAVVHKPFETEKLLETIRGALGYRIQKSA